MRSLMHQAPPWHSTSAGNGPSPRGLNTRASSGLLPCRRYSTSLTSNSVVLASSVAVVMGHYPPWGLIRLAFRARRAGRRGTAGVVLSGHALLDEVGASLSGQHRMVGAELASFHLLLRSDCEHLRARQNQERRKQK